MWENRKEGLYKADATTAPSLSLTSSGALTFTVSFSLVLPALEELPLPASGNLAAERDSILSDWTIRPYALALSPSGTSVSSTDA